ncbi:MAG TPA: hypothetical protein VH280_04130 [Verrucomicrobiae bacterium]|jgi:tetratricopeptide (TPR) repeat protein|nr:hypothetical protein [Verrucomicrobiae bacterium]
MRKPSSPGIGKNSALVLFRGAALAWLGTSSYLLGGNWSGQLSLSSDQNANAYLKSGMRDLDSGARKLAVEEFTKAIQLDPSFAFAYDARATTRSQMKDFAGAIKDCDKVIALTHHDEHVYLIEGFCRYQLHDAQGAVKFFNTAISMNSDNPLALDLLGVILAESQDWGGAMANFNKAVEMDPDDAMAYYGRAIVDFSFKDYEKSLANVSRAIKLKGTLSDAYDLRADVKAHLKDRAGALADANDRIRLDTSCQNGYVDRANVELMWDDFSDASNDLQTAIQINPADSGIYFCRGVLEQKCGNFQASLADFGRGLLKETDTMDTATAYEAMGYDHAEMGEWQPALESFRKAMAFKLPPNDTAFQVFQIECRLGQTQQAKKEMAAYIQSIPAAKAGDWTASIAHFLAGTLKEADFLGQATTTAKRPTDVAMQIGDAWYYAGMQHLLAGDKSGALKRFKKSLKFGDDNSNNYMMAKSLLGKN